MELERNNLAEGPCSRTEWNDLKNVGTCPALVETCLVSFQYCTASRYSTVVKCGQNNELGIWFLDLFYQFIILKNFFVLIFHVDKSYLNKNNFVS